MKNKKKVLALSSIVVLLGVALFATFGPDDLAGKYRTRVNMPTSTSTTTTEGPSMATGQMTTQAPGAATITRESYSGWHIRALTNLDTPIPPDSTGSAHAVNLLGTASCSESNYQPMGMWKMVVENRSLSLNIFKFQMQESVGVNFKLYIGTSPNGNNVAQKETYKPLNNTDLVFTNVFGGLQTGTYDGILPPGTYYITLYGKYHSSAPATWRNTVGPPDTITQYMTSSMSIKDNTIVGEFLSTNGLTNVPALFKTNSVGPVSNLWAHPNEMWMVGFNKDLDHNYPCRK